MGRRTIIVSAATGALVAAVLASPGATAPGQFSLTLRVIGPGTVAASPGARCAGYLTRVHTCRATYARGAKVRLAALPKMGAKLSSWRGVGGSGLTRTLTITGPKAVTATFVKRPTPSPSPPTPAPPALGSTRSNPLPLGAPVSIAISGGAERWRLRIISTQPEATAAVLAANQFNDPPAPGSQFFIATVGVDYVSGAQAWNPGIRIANDLKAVGPSNRVYSTFGSSSYCGVIPDNIDDKGDLLPGGSIVGNVCWSVPSSEAASLVAFIELNDKPYYMALR